MESFWGLNSAHTKACQATLALSSGPCLFPQNNKATRPLLCRHIFFTTAFLWSNAASIHGQQLVWQSEMNVILFPHRILLEISNDKSIFWLPQMECRIWEMIEIIMFHPNSQQKHDYPTSLLEFFDTIIGWQSLRLTQRLNIKICVYTILYTWFSYLFFLRSSLPFFNGGTTPTARSQQGFRSLSA